MLHGVERLQGLLSEVPSCFQKLFVPISFDGSASKLFDIGVPLEKAASSTATSFLKLLWKFFV